MPQDYILPGAATQIWLRTCQFHINFFKQTDKHTDRQTLGFFHLFKWTKQNEFYLKIRSEEYVERIRRMCLDETWFSALPIGSQLAHVAILSATENRMYAKIWSEHIIA